MEWNELSDDEKQLILKSIQIEDPELLLKIIAAVQPIVDAIMPVIDMFAKVGQDIVNNVFNTIFKDFPPELVEKMLKEAKK